MVTMREILTKFSGVRTEDLKGQRGPHLKPGREAQYEVRRMRKGYMDKRTFISLTIFLSINFFLHTVDP